MKFKQECEKPPIVKKIYDDNKEETTCAYKKGKFFRFRIDLSMIDTQFEHNKTEDYKNPFIYIDIEVVEEKQYIIKYLMLLLDFIECWCFNVFLQFEDDKYKVLDREFEKRNDIQHYVLTAVYFLQFNYIYSQHSMMKWIFTLITFLYMSYVSQIKSRLGYTAALFMMIFFNIGIALTLLIFYMTQWQPSGSYISYWSVDDNVFNWINGHIGFSSSEGS